METKYTHQVLCPPLFGLTQHQVFMLRCIEQMSACLTISSSLVYGVMDGAELSSQSLFLLVLFFTGCVASCHCVSIRSNVDKNTILLY